MPNVSNSRSRNKSHGRKKQRSKVVYRVSNWAAYEAGLKARGRVTVWFSPEALAGWYYQGPAQRGAQYRFSDLAIETALTLRLVYHLALRQTEGFVESVLALLEVDLAAPDHTTLSRRQCGLNIALPSRLKQTPLHIVVDSSGLKVYGEGEWKVRIHGAAGRRTWRKIHLGGDEASGEIVAQTLTPNSIDDASQVEALLEQIETPVEVLSGDGAYDKRKVFDTLAHPPRGTPIVPIIPPRKDAKIEQHGNGKAPPRARDETIRAIRKKGRCRWKQDSGYHRRSLIETQVFRYKQLIGDRLRARILVNQQVESRLGCAILNRMLHLAKPQAYAVEIID